MSVEPTPNGGALTALDEALRLTSAAARLQAAHRLMLEDFPQPIRNKAVELAVTAEDAAREAANVVRVALGGTPYPDPADPPPVRPDD